MTRDMTNSPKLMVIFASTRQGRQGEQLARWVYSIAHADSRMAAEFVDLRHWMLPYFDSPLSPLTGHYPLEVLPWAEKVAKADGFLIVTPEYNHGYPAVLKSALDAVYPEWGKKPIAFVGYGSEGGGARCVEQLRQVAVELQMVPTRESMVVAFPADQFENRSEPKDSALHDIAQSMLDELSYWTGSLRAVRSPSLAGSRRSA